MNEQFDEIIWKLWEGFAAFRQLGFSADDIYVCPSMMDPNTRQEGAGLILRAQNKQFVVFVGETKKTPDELSKEWTSFANQLNDIPDEVLTKRWSKSPFHRNSFYFIEALAGKGFTLPKTQN